MRVQAPLSVGTQKNKVKSPNVEFSSEGCRIKHMEYMLDLTSSSSGPTSQSFTINPQRAQVFTWLSAIATRFEMFKFNKLKFTYRPSCSTVTPGWVAIGFDFDFYDEAPTKATLLAWRYSTKTTPWAQTTLDVSSDSRIATYRYNNYDSLKGDARLDFLGNLWILIDTGAALAETIGEIFVEYDISFRQPSYKIPPALYLQIKGEPISGPTTDTLVKIAASFGNLLYEKIANNKIRIKDVGQFLVTLNTFITSGTFTTVPGITVSGPVGSVWTDSDTGVLTNVSANEGTAGRQLKVITAPVDLEFTGGAAGGSVLNRILISTFGENYNKLFA